MSDITTAEFCPTGAQCSCVICDIVCLCVDQDSVENSKRYSATFSREQIDNLLKVRSTLLSLFDLSGVHLTCIVRSLRPQS